MTLRSVRVTWFARPDKDTPLEEAPRRQDMCLLQDHADEPNTSLDNLGEIKKVLAITYSAHVNTPNDVFIETVESVCDCQPHPSYCKYKKFNKGGLRFQQMADPDIPGWDLIVDNEKNHSILTGEPDVVAMALLTLRDATRHR
ncbi:hypothetical protein ABZ543_13350 [Streptomyces roseifaciens]